MDPSGRELCGGDLMNVGTVVKEIIAKKSSGKRAKGFLHTKWQIRGQ